MNCKKIFRACLFCAILSGISGIVSAQSICPSNIHYRIIDETMEIFYDLPTNKDTTVVKVIFRKKSSPRFKYYPRFTSGACGVGIFSGANRKIVWHYKKEPEYILTGSGLYFDIYVTKFRNNHL
jgi:hypothetical protein